MEILAAIDLFKGQVVRLTRGDPSTAHVYSHDPVATAERWQQAGAKGLHVVDLDAALDLGSNLPLVKRIVDSVSIPVQIGGGIRSEDRARELLDAGARRIVAGTLAFRDGQSLARLVGDYGEERIVVALDFANGQVMTEGWRRGTAVTVDEALDRFCQLGVRQFLITAVERDGTLDGPDLKTYTRVAFRPAIKVMASGGIHNLSDLVELKKTGVSGVVVGKALYDGLVTIEDIRRVGHEP
jgi:phosphoribosylformimino-5-aminoimidazole carboxamide ribotide isomerase